MNATMRVYSLDGWQALAQAIVKQAAEDWRTAHKRMKRQNTDTRANLALIRDVESFFRGPAPEFLCDVNGQYILSLLREEVREAV